MEHSPEETQEPVAEETVAAEEEAVEEEEEEAPPSPPPAPVPRKRAPRKEKPRVQATPPAVPQVIDAAFWSNMLQTKREMDRNTRASQWANLVKF